MTLPLPIVIKNPSRLADGSYQFGFTNMAGRTIQRLGLDESVIDELEFCGFPARVFFRHFQFTDPQAQNNRQRFYRVSLP